MREITILSGKGGTGKTSVTASLAVLAKNAVFCDNDVDASDLHLLLQPKVKYTEVFKGARLASINVDLCENCGICAEACRYNAISLNNDNQFEVDEMKCEGCRLCERVCPSQAISSEVSLRNKWFISDTRFGEMVHAQLAPGEENSGKLVTLVRQQAKALALSKHRDFIINDGPPGIGCSTIASISGAHAVLLVIEPTISGLHDLKRLQALVAQFNIPQYALINKFDINSEVSNQVVAFLKEMKIPLLGKLPFNSEVVQALVNAQSIVEFNPESDVSRELSSVWNQLKMMVNNDKLQ